MNRVGRLILGCWLLLGPVWGARADESVVNSAHDLSARGPGRIRAVRENLRRVFRDLHYPYKTLDRFLETDKEPVVNFTGCVQPPLPSFNV